ncbi:hypothetical protein GM658_13340 [Pseudoduganella eburnea]|jgi:hypothetical protein|uniref:C-type lysozyme inhibitor domain-containing protein n=2 Tax=Massilia eburnea TaxID=1776165 RepID=A0A6L6QIX6_9BURK|nr:hypothetical protein [Massilia eburnea]
MSFMKLFTACAMALAIAAPSAHAAPKKAAAKPAVTKEQEPSVAGQTATNYSCELGNKITIYSSADDGNSIVMRWKNRLTRLTREATTTGAQRFENKLAGLIWIGIPAKGMLLDSKVNRQLANECKTSDQALGL